VRLFGLEFGLRKALPVPSGTLSPVAGSGGWYPLIRESFAGAWQRNVVVNTDTVLTYSAVFSVISLITGDIGKLLMRLVIKDKVTGIWEETDNRAFSPVLRKPNRYQTRNQFFANWVESKLISGNAYVFKARDQRNVVTQLYVLAPGLVTVLVAPDGAVFYELRSDTLAGIPDQSVTVPASEIIHDRWNTIYHPLVGTSPIHACGLAATQGLRIQENSAQFFGKGSNPGGIIAVPESINADKAREMKQLWDETYGAGKPTAGTVAVLSGGMTYIPMTINASDAQLLEQLKWTAETVCSTFHVPAHMIGIGQPPTYNNIEALNQQYYSQCLQRLIEDIEELMDDGLGLGPRFGNAYGTEFDLEGLLRMDSATQMKVASDGVRAGILKPDEGRAKFDLMPVPGGDTPYMQEQQWPLRHLAERALPGRPVSPPKEMQDNVDDGGNNTEPEPEPETAEERQRNVFRVAELLERHARAHERRLSA
jgi:HK97 family phage portal protein